MWLVSFTDVLSHLLTLLTQRYFLSVGLAAMVVWLGMFCGGQSRVRKPRETSVSELGDSK